VPDSELASYFAEVSRPRRVQHALVQVGERIVRGDPGVGRWYPQVIEAAASPNPELRQTAAWIMGQDRRYEPFRTALHRMLEDSSLLARRNAALALAGFRDPAARPALREMLRTYTVRAPAPGPVSFRLKAGEYVNPGTLVARIGQEEVRSPLPGEVRSLSRPGGAQVEKNDPLLELSPDEKHVWEALRGLWAVGGEDELEDIGRYARGIAGMPDRVRQQAALTAQAIRARRQ
ncbi:MAG: hypothetical protein FJW37_08850, partial [Acidobacteria bacterium]|nr:hypothetical protein [Acidobacteriota bacterium]